MRRRRQTALFTLLVVALCLSVILLTSAATLAWFALNAQVEEETYGISAKVTPNLIISSSAAAIGTMKADDAGVTEVTAAGFDDKFTPATHYTKNEYGITTTLPNLRCLSDYSLVDKYTGLSDSASLIDLPDDGKRYYVDYTVYVAATDTAIEDSSLKISLTGASHEAGDTLSWKAGSVDFYLDSVSEETFQGTLNLAGLSAFANNGETEMTELVIDLPDSRIPKNTDGYLALVLRCYFDGALVFPIGNGKFRAFVNSQTVSAGEVGFDILISDTPVS